MHSQHQEVRLFTYSQNLLSPEAKWLMKLRDFFKMWNYSRNGTTLLVFIVFSEIIYKQSPLGLHSGCLTSGISMGRMMVFELNQLKISQYLETWIAVWIFFLFILLRFAHSYLFSWSAASLFHCIFICRHTDPPSLTLERPKSKKT